MQIGRRIYYELTNGNVLVDTGERSGSVIETTTADDFAAYASLAERVPSTVGVIQLEFGELAQDFRECNGYRVNLDTQKIEISYPKPSDPEVPPVYQKALSIQIEELKNEATRLATRDSQMQDDQMFILEALVTAGII